MFKLGFSKEDEMLKMNNLVCFEAPTYTRCLDLAYTELVQDRPSNPETRIVKERYERSGVTRKIKKQYLVCLEEREIKKNL